MTREECRAFFKQVVFVHFPSLNSWLTTNSVDPVGTIDAWCQTLDGVTTAEAISVITRWTTDKLPRPTYLQMQDFALLIKSVVDRDRHDCKKHLIVQEIRQAPLVEKLPIRMASYYAEIFRNAKRYRDNEITLDECNRLNDAILQKASKQ